MFLLHKKTPRPVIKLVYIGNNEFVIEGDIPIEVINDMNINGFGGFRIITLKRLGSKYTRSFKVNFLNKNRKLRGKKPIKGVVLQRHNVPRR